MLGNRNELFFNSVNFKKKKNQVEKLNLYGQWNYNMASFQANGEK